MPHRDQFSSPKMSRAASFHSDEAWRKPYEELPHLCATQFTPNHDRAFGIHAMNLKHVFRQV
jgi:hypothetical protein